MRLTRPISLVLPLMAATWAFAAETPPAKISDDELFASGRLWTIHIRLTKEAWDVMQPVRGPGLLRLFTPGARPVNPARGPSGYVEGDRLPPSPFGNAYAYVRGDFDLDGQKLSNVGIRFKGNSSYQLSTRGLKRPFKIDFNRFVKGQKLAGLTQLNLNNNELDPTQIRDALSFWFFRESGLPASRTAFANVYLTVEGVRDREFLGLYTLIEEVNKPFLEDRFDSAKGLLLKPEGLYGLPYLGDDWKKYERYDAKTDPTPETARQFIEFTRLIHQADDETFAREIESCLDVDNLLRFVAVNAILANMDSYLTTGHNFYLYVHPKNGRVHLLPWDMNLSFGAFTWVGTAEQQMDLSIRRPYTGKHPLLDRLLAIDAMRARYEGHIRQVMETVFTVGKLHPQIDAMQRIIAESGRIAAEHGMAGSPTTRPTVAFGIANPDLKLFIDKRRESITAQLAGQRDGHSPVFSLGPRRRPADRDRAANEPRQ